MCNSTIHRLHTALCFAPGVRSSSTSRHLTLSRSLCIPTAHSTRDPFLLYPRQQRGSGRACDSQGPEARLSKKNKGFHSPVWTGGGERGNASAGWGTQQATHRFSSDNFLTMSLSGLRALRRNIPCSHKITDLIILYCDCTVFLFSGV